MQRSQCRIVCPISLFWPIANIDHLSDLIEELLPRAISGVRLGRMDGATGGDERLRIVQKFNNTNQIDVLLMSKVCTYSLS